ncbi:MAG: hypothetical protein ACYDDP_06585 [Acidithiobacillus sp.]
MSYQPQITMERAWLRVQTFSMNAPAKLVLRPKQEQLLNLLRDHHSLAPAEIWAALGVSRQGAMDLAPPAVGSWSGREGRRQENRTLHAQETMSTLNESIVEDAAIRCWPKRSCCRRSGRRRDASPDQR